MDPLGFVQNCCVLCYRHFGLPEMGLMVIVCVMLVVVVVVGIYAVKMVWNTNGEATFLSHVKSMD